MSFSIDKSEEWCKLLEDTKLELGELLDKHVNGIMFRSKVQWYCEGERNSAYFFGLEKMRYNARTCTKIIREDGTCAETDADILAEQRRFYAELYTADPQHRFLIK